MEEFKKKKAAREKIPVVVVAGRCKQVSDFSNLERISLK